MGNHGRRGNQHSELSQNKGQDIDTRKERRQILFRANTITALCPTKTIFNYKHLVTSFPGPLYFVVALDIFSELLGHLAPSRRVGGKQEN
jgi:hypothetical protein